MEGGEGNDNDTHKEIKGADPLKDLLGVGGEKVAASRLWVENKKERGERHKPYREPPPRPPRARNKI